MDILESIKYDNLSVKAMEYYQCEHCRVVDKEDYRLTVGAPCRVCQKPGEGPMPFFDVAIVSIIGLIQEAFCAIPEAPKNVWEYPEESERAHSGATIVFFCTLKELLLERFLDHYAYALKLPKGVIKRLQEDNDSHSRRLNNLFPSLIGLTWEKAIAAIDPSGEKRYADLSTFLKDVSDKRNRLLHVGADWDMTKPMAETCIRYLFPLLELYVQLHNSFVHPLYKKRCTP